jgi:hypothetical protein
MRRLMTELTMYSKSQFYALEVMCRQRAAVARKEMEYWLNEAEEWTQVSTITRSDPTLHPGGPGTEKNRRVELINRDK